MKKFLLPPNHKLSFNQNVHRMDPIQPFTVEPTLVSNHISPMVDFPKDFFPMMAKKYPPSSQIYKHVYVSAPNKFVEMKPKKKKKKKKEKDEESWFDFHPFGNESEEEDEEEKEYDED